jgi:glycosyltransferase involved in cell wall biosynthesis
MKNTCCFNGRFLTQPVTGVQRYAIEVLKKFDELISEKIDQNKYSFNIICPNVDLISNIQFKHIQVKKVGNCKGHIWEQTVLPLVTRKNLLVNLCNTGPIFHKNQIVTIHDAAVFVYPENYSKLFRYYYTSLLPLIGKKSRAIITVSNFSKSELKKFCHLHPDKIKVIYLGKEHILDINESKDILKKFGIVDEKYILSVGSLAPNKNFAAVIKAIQLLDKFSYKFVIAGGTNPKIFNNSLKLPNNVIQLGYVTDSELKALYQNATCFVFASLYEGFGLTPLEAMTCGCPVICSNAASLPEIYCDTVLYCDPHDPEDISQKINLLMSDRNLHKSLQQKGLEKSKEFSWKKCAEQIWNTIEEIMNSKNY